MLVPVTKWTALVVFGGTLAVGGVLGWVLRGSGEALPVLAVPTDPPVGVRQGDRVEVPSRPSSEAPVAAPATATFAPVPTPGAWYRLAAGDTLSEVSQKAYGTTKRVDHLLQANPGLDARRLPKGQSLYIPPVEALRAAPAK